jgi:hypothetical protein
MVIEVQVRNVAALFASPGFGLVEPTEEHIVPTGKVEIGSFEHAQGHTSPLDIES